MPKKAGPIKSGLGTLIGNAGEYFVVAELLKRGVIAAMAPRNTPGFDVLATDGVRSVNIRVKTRSPAAKSWVWNVKEDGAIFRNITDNDFTVAVDLRSANLPPEFFVFQTRDLDMILTADFESWLEQPGRNDRPHSPDNPQRRLGTREHHTALLESAKSRWNLILAKLSGR